VVFVHSVALAETAGGMFLRGRVDLDNELIKQLQLRQSVQLCVHPVVSFGCGWGRHVSAVDTVSFHSGSRVQHTPAAVLFPPPI
jgi:hypothetical protein